MTTLESLRSNRENAAAKVDVKRLRSEYAKICAKYFEAYRKAQIENLFDGEEAEAIHKELAAFNADTKNGTRLIFALSSTMEFKEGNTIVEKETGKVLFENVDTFHTLKTTNEEGKTIRTKVLYSCPFVPETANDNDRVITYWLDNYRYTVANSIAERRAERERAQAAEDNKIKAFAEFMNISYEEAKAMKEAAKKKESTK